MSKRKIKNLKRWIAAVIVLAVLFILIYLPSKQTAINPVSEKATTTVAATPVAAPSDLFQNLKLQAQAVYVIDISTNKVIYAKNENEPLPLASLTKLMTALVSSSILSDSATVTVSTSSLAIEGDNGLVANELWSFKDLRNFTLLVSSNDGANALALASATELLTHSSSTDPAFSEESSSTLEQTFVKQMNNEAATLNLSTLHYQNESGLDVDNVTAGAIGSAKDISQLFRYILQNRPDILDITKHHSFKFTSLSGVNHSVLNTDEDITKISGILASKTGYTLLAGGNLVIAYNPGLSHAIIIAVLGSTASGRFSDTLALASSTRAYLMKN